MKPKIVPKLSGFIVQMNGKELFYTTLQAASNKVASYYNKKRRKRVN